MIVLLLAFPSLKFFKIGLSNGLQITTFGRQVPEQSSIYPQGKYYYER
jgi:hypothetical protein